MPIQSPAKDLRKTFAGALFGQRREMGSAQPTERPSQGLCSDRGAKRSQNSPPKDLEKPFKGRCTVADPTSRYSGASGQKNEGEHPLYGCSPCSGNGRTCRDGLVVTDEHSHPAYAGAVLLTSAISHLREMGTHQLWASVPTCAGTPPVTDEHRTNCNTRSPRKIRSYRNRGPPCGNQSGPSESRR